MRFQKPLSSSLPSFQYTGASWRSVLQHLVDLAFLEDVEVQEVDVVDDRHVRPLIEVKGVKSLII